MSGRAEDGADARSSQRADMSSPNRCGPFRPAGNSADPLGGRAQHHTLPAEQHTCTQTLHAHCDCTHEEGSTNCETEAKEKEKNKKQRNGITHGGQIPKQMHHTYLKTYSCFKSMRSGHDVVGRGPPSAGREMSFRFCRVARALTRSGRRQLPTSHACVCLIAILVICRCCDLELFLLAPLRITRRVAAGPIRAIPDPPDAHGRTAGVTHSTCARRLCTR